MTESNFQKRLLEELVLYFQPLLEGAADPGTAYRLLQSLGWNATSLFGPPPNAFMTAWKSAAEAVNAVEQATASPPESLDDLVQALGAVQAVVDAIGALPGAVGSGQPPELGALAADLLELLTLAYLEQRAPAVVELLRVLTIVRSEERSALVKGNDLVRTDGVIERLDLSRISMLLSDPITTLQNHYFPSGLATDADATLATIRIFPAVAGLLNLAGAQAVIGRGDSVPYLDEQTEQALARTLTAFWHIGDDATDVELGLTARLLSAQEQGPSVLLLPVGAGQIEIILGTWHVSFSMAASGGVLVISPEKIEAGLGDTSLDASVSIGRTSAEDTPLRIGSTTGTRLEAAVLSFDVQGAFKHLTNGTDLMEIGLSALIKGGRFVVSAGDGDGFLQKVLPKDGFSIEFDLGIGWSNHKGLYFRGSAGLEATLPIHKDLFGVLKVDSIYLALRVKDNDIETIAAATASIKLGPFSANVERIGLLAKFTFPKEGGNLGPANVELGFKPPNGAGLVIDGSVIVGGGYLFFDPANEQYAGVLQLEIKDVLCITAIGLLTTRMPDGSKGFSLLIIITAQFPPIQLGFGFSLNGLGGLLGVNRRMVLEVLRAGVKNRTLDSIMFPVNPVANASRIISDLQSVFPPASGRFVFGPMAELSWGKPATILTIQLGIVLEVPSPVRLAIMGKLTLVLPTLEVPAEAQIVVLHLDVLGTIDFATGDAGIDATLYDSRIATFPITGDMAMRLNWGASPAFAVSVGGFHPRFQPPPNFPSLDRLAIALSTSDNPRIRLEAYLAMTTNTVQLGARLDIYAEINIEVLGKFSASGFLGFDALVHFPPFSFVVDIEGGVTIKHNGNPILSGSLFITLSGPDPWHAWGEATLEFFGKRVIPINLTIGHALPPLPLPPGDPRGELVKALADVRNWSAQLPSDGHMLVTLREIEISNEVLLHPLGELTFRQKVVPLDIAISKFGSTTPNNPGPFTIAEILFDGLSTQSTRQMIKGLFAPGPFFNLSDEEMIARPAVEAFAEGCNRIATAAISQSDVQVPASFQYDTVVIDNKEELVSRRGAAFKYAMAENVLFAIADLGAAGQSAMRSTGSAKFAGDSKQRVKINDPEYAVTSTEDMSHDAELSSYTEAEAARRAKGPQKDQYQVVGKQEVA